jgi:GT2 family glycosyltransferase
MARGNYFMFLNNDTEPRKGWLSALVRTIESDPQIAIVGSKLLYPDGTIQHGGVGFSYAGPLPIFPFHLFWNSSWLTV